MRVDAALTDEPKIGQARDERRADRGALANKDQHLGLGEALCKAIQIFDMIVPDRDLVPGELGETRQCAESVEGVVEDGDLHAPRFRSKMGSFAGGFDYGGAARRVNCGRARLRPAGSEK